MQWVGTVNDRRERIGNAKLEIDYSVSVYVNAVPFPSVREPIAVAVQRSAERDIQIAHLIGATGWRSRGCPGNEPTGIRNGHRRQQAIRHEAWITAGHCS